MIITVDPHVHIYDCYKLNSVFDFAFSNLSGNYKNKNDIHLLCLTETSSENFFSDLISKKRNDLGGWLTNFTDESNSVELINQNNKLFLIAGRQIITKENIEVLAIGLTNKYPDGNPINKVINDIINNNYILVLPWGFGKWTGNRKKILENTILEFNNSNIFVGDNGNRPWFFPRSNLLNIAEKKGMKCLSGSDPLPIEDEEKRIGRFGVTLHGEFNKRTPYKSLYNLLNNPQVKLTPFGKLESMFPFFRNQIYMQLRKNNKS